MWTDPGNIKIAHKRHMNMVNMEIATEAAQFPEKEYINGIFFAVHYERDDFAYDLMMILIMVILMSMMSMIMTLFRMERMITRIKISTMTIVVKRGCRR
jgi:hypothetical protein